MYNLLYNKLEIVQACTQCSKVSEALKTFSENIYPMCIFPRRGKTRKMLHNQQKYSSVAWRGTGGRSRQEGERPVAHTVGTVTEGLK